ncbi:hypothetical protein [Intestinirhabdus alba]|jgi:hypothetical protein|uniref:Uncharacterized protein n=1 Tax=Intestinirhabdus alba TaxID=2899544 RepID=A0A6L6ILT6_9ENTR|nr:hypothetical protein [Intestinirhabdus alba]MTH46000.1 hypothetical protein [Intestinirhabdus alba]
MELFISLAFLGIGLIVFHWKPYPYKILSSIILYYAIRHDTLLQCIYVAITGIALISLCFIKASKNGKEIFYFSMPCWLEIISCAVRLIDLQHQFFKTYDI